MWSMCITVEYFSQVQSVYIVSHTFPNVVSDFWEITENGLLWAFINIA